MNARKKAVWWLGVVMLMIGLIAVIAGCSSDHKKEQAQQAAAPAGHHRFVDRANREVILPDQIKKVYPVSPIEASVIYTLAPDVLMGWSYHMQADEVPYILPEYRNLPVIGWVNRGSTSNAEEIIKLKPDVILLMQTINDKNKAYADELQRLTKIPVVFLEEDGHQYAETYRMAGKMLQREERAESLAAYAEETWQFLKAGEEKVQARQPVKAYYAEGRRGLETEPKGSWHAQFIEWAHGDNVADANLPAGSKIGRSPVTLEQIVRWNPEVIFIGYFRDGEASSYSDIMHDPAWRQVRAVQNKRVYEIPTAPFNWVDRPPSVSRLLGLRWVANKLYPDIYEVDMKAEVKRFYKLFYHFDLTDEQVVELIGQ